MGVNDFNYIFSGSLRMIIRSDKGFIAIIIAFLAFLQTQDLLAHSKDDFFAEGYQNSVVDNTISQSLLNQNLSSSSIDYLVNNYDSIYPFKSVSRHEKHLSHLISESNRLKYSNRIPECYNKLGVIQRDNSLFEKALDSHKKALALAEDNELQKIRSNNNLGVVYRRLDKPRLALSSHMLALTLIDNYDGEWSDVDFEKRVALNSIGNINLSLNQALEALKYFQESLQMELVESNTLGIAINYGNIGFAYQIMNNDKKAKEYYEKSLVENSKIHSDLGKAVCFNSIGDLYFKESDYPNAKQHYDSALFYSLKLDDVYHSAEAQANLAQVYIRIDSLTLAFQHLQKYRRQALSTKSGSLNYESNLLFSEYYEKVGQYDSALVYFKRAEQFNDSIINEKNSRYLNEMQVVYDSEKKEQQIDLLTAENEIKNQRMRITWMFVAILVVVVGFLVFLSLYRKRQTAYMQADLKQQLLRSQMNPHFIFNVLGSIQNYMLKNDSKKAARYLSQFASLSRSVLEFSELESISLDKEVEMLKNYIELENMKSGNRFNFEIEMDEMIEADFIEIPPMMIQVFVENAIKHGLSGINHQGLLRLSVKEDKEYIEFVIEDNGEGLRDEKHHDVTHKSMAMKIFNQRKKLIEQRSGKTLKFELINIKDVYLDKSGVRVTIHLPILNND